MMGLIPPTSQSWVRLTCEHLGEVLSTVPSELKQIVLVSVTLFPPGKVA